MPNEKRPQSRQERRRQERRREVVRQEQKQKQTTTFSRRNLFIGAPIVVLLLVLGGGYLAFANNGGPQPGSTIAGGITCEAEMLQFHIHDHLTLYRNGKQVPVPALIGIPYNSSISVGGQNTCLYWLHTHAADGILHVESPVQTNFTLDQFFTVWHYTALWDSQGSLAAASGVSVDDSFVTALRNAKPSDIHAYVNGKPVPDYKSINLLPQHQVITIELGAPLVAPDKTYNFKGI